MKKAELIKEISKCRKKRGGAEGPELPDDVSKRIIRKAAIDMSGYLVALDHRYQRLMRQNGKAFPHEYSDVDATTYVYSASDSWESSLEELIKLLGAINARLDVMKNLYEREGFSLE